jgi:hypothetical protein
MKDRRIDEYIANAPAFARPILKELRGRVHRACPEAIETLKWSAPYFEYGGKLLCGMSAFKHHCAFGFWHPAMRNGDKSLEGMGQFGRIESLSDLPSPASFARLARKAMKLIDDGVKVPQVRARKKPLEIPADLAAGLSKSARARATFGGFSPGKRREYIEWIAAAKREETRALRLARTLEWLAEGKALYWKYENR